MRLPWNGTGASEDRGWGRLLTPPTLQGQAGHRRGLLHDLAHRRQPGGRQPGVLGPPGRRHPCSRGARGVFLATSRSRGHTLTVPDAPVLASCADGASRGQPHRSVQQGPRTHPKRAPETNTRSISSSAIAHFGRYATVPGTPAAARRVASPLQSSGRNRRRPTPTGTSARAKVSETRAWQLARLPSWPQYWRLTPTEWRPCFTRAVSSTTRAASGPPTSRSARPSAALTSWSSRGAVAQGEVETKWCSCWVSAGATLAAMGSTLLRSPGRSRPLR